MKARGIIGGLCVVGVAVATVCGVVLHTGRPTIPTAEANAAEPVKPGEPAKPEGGKGGGPRGGNYSLQYERTKQRAVVRLTGEYPGGYVDNKYIDPDKAAEYEVQVSASRSRGVGGESEIVWVERKWVKVKGAEGVALPVETVGLSAGDAASAVLFIEAVKGTKKSPSEVVNYARLEWAANTRRYTGERTTSVLKMLSEYGGKLTFEGDSGLGGMVQWDQARLADVLTEGLKDLVALRKAEWSPAP